MFLAGRRATVAGVFTDVDGEQHVAVTLDDDPAAEELAWQGRYLSSTPTRSSRWSDQEREADR